MRKTAPALLLATLAIPLVLSLGAVWWLLRDDTERQNLRAQAVLASYLNTMEKRSMAALTSWETSLQEFVKTLLENPEPSLLRQAREGHPLIRMIALIDSEGSLVYPDLEAASYREKEFLDRSANLLAEPWLPARSESGEYKTEGGWQRFYWREGAQIMYWLPLASGKATSGRGFLLCEIEEAALYADFMAALDPPPFPNARHSLSLHDSTGNLFASWGKSQNAGKEKQIVSQRALSGAFQGWQFTWVAAANSIPGIEDHRALIGLGAGLSLALASILSFLLFRRMNHSLREAGQRVSFVNQVSHELKTPLTNIRLYAELLEARLQKSQLTKELEFATVILRESDRLARLIHNVLTFARTQSTKSQTSDPRTLALNPRPTVPNELVARCLESFRPSLEIHGIQSRIEGSLSEARNIDPDLVEQMLGNLIGNVEKYASSGKVLIIRLLETTRGFRIEVEDRGPGLPPHMEEKAFEPFTRFHTKHTDGAGGAGLGLAIVRDLAQRHKGTAAYKPAEPNGACFWFEIGDLA